MPKLNMKEEFKLKTRDRYTEVECEVSIRIDGREVPTMGVIGEALEKCITMLQEHITESYAKVPERV